MSKEKGVVCTTCEGKLSDNELNDNIYAGHNENEYICYVCQSTEIDLDDIEVFPFDDDDNANDDF